MTKKDDQNDEPKMTPEEISKMRQGAETATSYEDAQILIKLFKKMHDEEN